MNAAAAAIAKQPAESPERVAELEDLVAPQRREIQLLREKLHYALHRQFGRSAERFDAGQSELFDPPTDEDLGRDVDDDTTEIVVRRKKGGRRKAPKDLPRVRVEHDLPEADKQCRCGACLTRIGEETTEQYDVIPPVFRVLEHVRFKYACPVCDDHGVTTAPKASPDPLPRHQVSAGLLAWLGTSKYVDGLPLHRVAAILAKRFGVDFTSTTLAQWMIKAGEELFAPLLGLLDSHLLQVDYLHVDETTVQVLDEPDRYAWQKSYFWVRVTGTGPPIIRVDYAPSRAGAVAEGLLSGFKGYLQTDAYAGYNGVSGCADVTAVGCLAHARRRFDAVLKSVGQHSKRPEAVLARDALAFIRRLYQIEKAIKGKPSAERLRRRQTDSQAVLDEFAHWREHHLDRVAAFGGALARAFGYLGNHWDALTRFVEDERLQLDNNRAERHIRPIATGRKVWLFARSQRGAHASAAWYSIVETAKANSLEPYHYLRWLLSELPRYQQQGLALDALLPWNVAPEQIKAPSPGRV
jgi:transposase